MDQVLKQQSLRVYVSPHLENFEGFLPHVSTKRRGPLYLRVH